MQKCEQLYEGKAKKVFLTDDPDVLIVSYKDDATAFNGLKKGTIVGKGAINNRMTNLLFQKIEEEGIPTHFIQELNDRETAVRRVEIVPLEVIVRNVAAGSFSKRLGVEEVTVLLFHGKIILADEISPDTCRLWDVESGEKMDKDRFRRDLGGVEDAYIQVAKRLGLEMESK